MADFITYVRCIMRLKSPRSQVKPRGSSFPPEIKGPSRKGFKPLTITDSLQLVVANSPCITLHHGPSEVISGTIPHPLHLPPLLPPSRAHIRPRRCILLPLSSTQLPGTSRCPVSPAIRADRYVGGHVAACKHVHVLCAQRGRSSPVDARLARLARRTRGAAGR